MVFISYSDVYVRNILNHQGFQRCHAFWKPKKVLKTSTVYSTGPFETQVACCFNETYFLDGSTLNLVLLGFPTKMD